MTYDQFSDIINVIIMDDYMIFSVKTDYAIGWSRASVLLLRNAIATRLCSLEGRLIWDHI